MTITIAHTEAEIRRCLPAVLALRPHLPSEQAVERIQFQQVNDGYVLAFVDEGNSVEPAPAVVGYRFLNVLHTGKTLYIDDLSTLPEARGKGYASVLLDFVIDQARQLGCQTVSLDSGHGPDRADAHRLYLNKRFRISSHHFSLTLSNEPRQN